MEVINVISTGQDTQNLYSQNNNIPNKCNFENRDNTPQDHHSVKYFNTKNLDKSLAYENAGVEIVKTNINNQNYHKYTIPTNYVTIAPSSYTENSFPENHYQLLVNTNDKSLNTSSIDITSKYSEGGNQINFNRKNYVEQEGVSGNSVTNNDTYENEEFWKKQQPNIQLGEYMIRDTTSNFYNKFNVEGYTSHIYPMDNLLSSKKKNAYIRRDKQNNYAQPKVSPNYTTNYTIEGTKVVHEGVKKRGNTSKYKKRVDTYSDQIVGNDLYYYEDNVYNNRKNENFPDINLELKEYTNMNGGKYQEFVDNSSTDTELTNHEKNILLNRNNNILAGINSTSRYEY